LDLEEFLYKFYDLSELLSIKDKFARKSKEFGILKIKLMMHEKRKMRKEKEAKEIKEEDEEAWMTASDEEDKEKSEQVDTGIKKKSLEKAKEENLRETDDSENDDIGPIVLPNGELLLENGVT